ncbi:xylose isomerase domain-containing protein [Salinarchaeum sp. Harcht-Bsk1]|uniref:sugar phosphate isomerase/epimerase family protein n=1 Tax=Salinarchaeum sp. Harcht-Bsk1 TaxID=1333523 RepID=UPI000342370F|nr:TIM barrel protein [Salinarchaeum sp. Harcht-Bsk1]AGN02468.1 xylose isomerase domain-containing protein [Salinarchaeum sp. Harcht-Bsk1]
MHLGGPVHDEFDTPAAWIDALDERGYTAATAPVDPDADPRTIEAFVDAADEAGVVIAEVGAWEHNPIADDPDEREAAIDACARHLQLADEIGANCCVNVAGSRGNGWAAPHPENFTEETFERVVASVQEIIDRVDPETAEYALEPMPWIFPHDVESHHRLLEAVDRDAYGVHFDPVNMLSSPERVARNADFVERFVDELGEEISTVHLKDVVLRDELTTHVDEVRPGAGTLDYHALLSALDALDDDLPLLLEHLDDPEEYERAANYVREVAADVGVDL